MNFLIYKVKIVVMVPISSIDIVREAILEEKAGIIGNYTHCSTSVKCIGTFMPNDNANPYIGSNNKIEVVEEEKLEVICDIENAKEVINKIRSVHPYEEAAIDIIPLINEKDLI